MERKIVEYYCKRGIQHEMIKHIKGYEGQSAFAAVRGFLFEAIAHRILAMGGEFVVCLQPTIPATRFLSS